MTDIKRPPEYQQQNGPYYDRLDYCLADDVRQYAEDMEEEVARLQEALKAIANDFDEWGDTIARYTMYQVAKNALQEAEDE